MTDRFTRWLAENAHRLVVTGVAGSLCVAASGCPPESLGRSKMGYSVSGEKPVIRRPPAEQVQPLDPALAQAARQTLSTEAAAQEPAVRAHAIEGERDALNTQGTADYLRALSDNDPKVRFAATMAIGELKVAVARATLLGMVGDKNRIVQVGVRFALHRIGVYTYSHELERFAGDNEPGVRGAVAMALGRLGETSADKILMVLRKDPNAAVRQQASEALWRLGEQIGASDLAGLVLSHYRDDQMFGMLALASTHNESVRQNIRPLLARDNEDADAAKNEDVRIVAAWAFGMIGGGPYDIGYWNAMDGTKSGDPRVRVLAARALGAIGRTDFQLVLRDMLKDSDAEVRIAAAVAILQLTPPEKRAAGE